MWRGIIGIIGQGYIEQESESRLCADLPGILSVPSALWVLIFQTFFSQEVLLGRNDWSKDTQ